MAPPHAAPVSRLACHDARRWRILPNHPATMGLTRHGLLTTVAPWRQPCAVLSCNSGSGGYAAAVHVQPLGCHASSHDAPADALARPRMAPTPDPLHAPPRREGEAPIRPSGARWHASSLSRWRDIMQAQRARLPRGSLGGRRQASRASDLLWDCCPSGAAHRLSAPGRCGRSGDPGGPRVCDHSRTASLSRRKKR